MDRICLSLVVSTTQCYLKVRHSCFEMLGNELNSTVTKVEIVFFINGCHAIAIFYVWWYIKANYWCSRYLLRTQLPYIRFISRFFQVASVRVDW